MNEIDQPDNDGFTALDMTQNFETRRAIHKIREALQEWKDSDPDAHSVEPRFIYEFAIAASMTDEKGQVRAGSIFQNVPEYTAGTSLSLLEDVNRLRSQFMRQAGLDPKENPLASLFG